MMAFFTSRLGVGLIAALLAALITFTATSRYYNNAAEVTALKSQLAAVQADIAIARNAESTARAAALALEQRATENRGHVDELVREIESRPERGGCRIDDADAERLRRIR